MAAGADGVADGHTDGHGTTKTGDAAATPPIEDESRLEKKGRRKCNARNLARGKT